MNRKTTTQLFVLSIVLFTIPHAQASEKEPAFADHLFSNQEYYRAITEYERFLFEQPESNYRAQANFQIGYAFFKGERYAQARSHIQKTTKKFPQSEQAQLAPLLLSASYAAEQNYALAAMKLDSFASQQVSNLERENALIQAGLYFMRANKMDAASEVLALIPKGSKNTHRVALLSSSADQLETLSLKSPKLAGSLSAIVPGAGQLYIGKKSDALIAFVLNGVLIYGSYEAFDNGEHVTGALLAIIETGWYGGNIYNAVNSAHKVNRERKECFFRDLEVQCRPFWRSEKLGVDLEALFKF